MNLQRRSLLFLVAMLGWSTFAETSLSHQSNRTETSIANAINQRFLQQFVPLTTTPTWKPTEDTADFGYILMNSEEGGSSEVTNLRKTIAQNLPADVKLVILAPKAQAEAIRAKYLKWIPESQLIIAADASPYTTNGFWARDSFPVPVQGVSSTDVQLISAQYFRKFSSGETIAKSVMAPMTKVDAVFVGGNLLADEDGQCFAIDSSRMYGMTTDVLKHLYGCKDVKLLEHVSGIGDVDEVLKPLPGKRILTTTPEYKTELEAMGYQLIYLPRINNSYRTYANSLVVGKKVFMPTFGVATDEQATKVYVGLGYEVVPIRTNYLSDELLGSIHCQTMAYPRMDQTLLFKALGIKAI